MPDPDPLIATRFHIPPSRAGSLPRPVLIQILDQVCSLPLAVISAPPGFGKTTLAVDWLRTQEDGSASDCCWLSLHPSDNLPVTFWRYFTAAIQRVIPDFGIKAQSLLSASPPAPTDTILAYLVNDLASRPRPIFLVLDDYHVIHLKDIHGGLNFLLDHSPGNFHLVLATREDPPLALARRRARRQVVEIRAADLRFKFEETAGYFLKVAGLPLSEAQLIALDQRVEGWAVGLQLAALSLQSQPDRDSFFQSLAGLDRAVADYLVEEVLQNQPAEVREFLLKSSVLESLSAPLCEAVMAGSEASYQRNADSLQSPFAALLDHLERANLFLLPLDRQREWYRYHPLFAQLLRQRLRQLYGETEAGRLQGLASRWFEDRQDPSGAIQYAFQAGDPERAARLLQKFAPLFFIRSDLPQFLAWVVQLPVSVRENNPALSMAAAWAGLATNQLQEVKSLLAGIEKNLGVNAESVFENPDVEAGLKVIMLEILVLRLRLDDLIDRKRRGAGYLRKLSATLESIPDEQMGLFTSTASLKPVAAFNLAIEIELSVELIPARSVFREAAEMALRDQNFHILLLSLSHLGNIQLQLGYFESARQTFEEALARAAELELGDSPFCALAYDGLAWLDYQANHLDEAREKFQAARRLASPWSNWESLLPAVTGLAAVHQALGEPVAALRVIEEFLNTEKSTIPGLFSHLEATRALLLAENGSPGEAEKWISSHSFPDLTVVSARLTSEILTRARLLLLLDRRGDAQDLLENLIVKVENAGLKPALLETRIQLALTLASSGEIRPAVEVLQTALRESGSSENIRAFLDGGETIRRLLLVARTSLGTGHPLAGRIRSLLTYFVSGEEAFPDMDGAGRLIEPLSEREREVLRLLADGLSNKEIAARLIISLATVKTHIANIYQKLDAASRTQAVARAEALGLLQPR